jgi:DNA-binding NtrC family response regulator
VELHLPRIEAPAQESDDRSEHAASGQTQKGAVLLVEDDLDVRIVVSAQLKKLGYRVTVAANGDEAIDLIASPATIDILLTDIVLPGTLDGVGLIKEAMLARPGLGILCMTGYNPTPRHIKWLQLQNITLLEKPFSSDKLALALSTATASSEIDAEDGAGQAA